MLTILQRKVDWHVLPQLIFIYLLSYADRSNVANAKLYGAATDMKMSSTQWNIGLSVFCGWLGHSSTAPTDTSESVITYALAGPPSNMALKRFGPKRVLPIILLCVSFVLIGSGCASTFGQWIALRMRECPHKPGCG
jgi:MFS family permease